MAFELNYTAPPTVARFMASDARMRVILGPQGCLPADTEFLTPTGWKRMDAYEEGDEVQSYAAETGQFAFVKPDAYINLPAEGFYVFKGPKGLHQVLSPEHRVLLSTGEVIPARVLTFQTWHSKLIKLKPPKLPLIVKDKVVYATPSGARWRAPVEGERKYCFTVPTGFFVARHNGSVFITGNSGKSSGSVAELIRRAVNQAPDNDGIRRSRWMVVRRTMPQLKTTTIKTFLDWVPPGALGTWKETDKTYHLQFGDVRAEIMFMALDTADDVSKLLSLESTGCYFNEFRDIDPDIFEGMTKRLGRYPSKKGGPGATWYGIWADTNPPKIGSWLHRMMENLDEDLNPLPPRTDEWAWAVFKQPSGRSAYAENIENLPEGYYSAEGYSPEYVKVMIDGEYGMSLSGTPVYGNTFKRVFHAAKQNLTPFKSEKYPIIIGMDFGRTPACVIGQRTTKGQVLLYDNVTSVNMGLETFVKTKLRPLLSSKYLGHPVLVIGDPAGVARSQYGEENAYDVLKRLGLKARPAPTNDPERRIEGVETLLSGQIDGEALLLIDPRCRSLLDGFEWGYCFKEKRDGSFTDAIDKNSYSHEQDAMQYFASAVLGEVRGVTTQSGRKEIKRVSNKGWT